MLTFYAIRHKASGQFMPARMFRTTSRGWTHWEPDSKIGYAGFGTAPRLFETKHAASVAITYWAKGGWEVVKQAANSWEEPYYEEERGTAPTTPTNPRQSADLEVVTFFLKEIKCPPFSSN